MRAYCQKAEILYDAEDWRMMIELAPNFDEYRLMLLADALMRDSCQAT